MIINAYECPECNEIIYSRARHDYKKCSCNTISVDGGFDYLKVTFKKIQPNLHRINLDVTEEELYYDWNNNINKYGIYIGIKK